MKKYEFTGETKKIDYENIIVRRIRAIISFGNVNAGDLGGWIEKEENLFQENNAWVYGNAEVYDNAEVYGDAWVHGVAEVYGDTEVYYNAEVCGNAEVLHTNHLLVIGPAGSRNDFTTFFRDKDNEITVKCGCFLGNIDEFLKMVKETHGDNKYALIYKKVAEIAKLQIEND